MAPCRHPRHGPARPGGRRGRGGPPHPGLPLEPRRGSRRRWHTRGDRDRRRARRGRSSPRRRVGRARRRVGVAGGAARPAVGGVGRRGAHRTDRRGCGIPAGDRRRRWEAGGRRVRHAVRGRGWWRLLPQPVDGGARGRRPASDPDTRGARLFGKPVGPGHGRRRTRRAVGVQVCPGRYRNIGNGDDAPPPGRQHLCRGAGPRARRRTRLPLVRRRERRGRGRRAVVRERGGRLHSCG